MPRQAARVPVFTEFWSQDEISDLLALVRATGFRSTTASYPLPRYEHVGEVEPLAEGPGGGCSSSILNPNKERTHCVYPERIDVAAHQLVSGGIDARRESYATTVSRLIVQQHYFYAEGSADSVNTGGSGGQKEDRVEAVPAVANLFRSPHYLREARKLCQWPGDDGDGDAAVGDRNDIVLHPMTLAMIITLPGQMVAMHLDVPFFRGADRRDFPSWLLVAMQTSGLFRDIRIPQVQGVAYLHQWAGGDAAGERAEADRRRGGFYMYANGTHNAPRVTPAAHNSAIICDGSEMVHGTQTYVAEAVPPPITKDALFEMAYDGVGADDGAHRWALLRDGERVRVYRESDLRITLVWRQHCFRNANEHSAWRGAQRFRDEVLHAAAQQAAAAAASDDDGGGGPSLPSLTDVPDIAGRLKLSDVLDTLTAELQRRGASTVTADSSPLRLLNAFLGSYTSYPYPHGALPYNFCALEALLPSSLRWIVASVC